LEEYKIREGIYISLPNIIYKQTSLNIYRCLNHDLKTSIPNTIDLLIYAKLRKNNDSLREIDSKSLLNTISLLSRTLVIDLEKEETEIFTEFHRHNKQEIKRAEKEVLHHEVLLFPNTSEVQSFIDFFQTFAEWKSIPLLPEDRFRKAVEAGVLSITWIRDELQNPLCGHAYLHDDNRVIMINSASHRVSKDSPTRRLISRANRLLHWQNILFYRSIGVKWYDFSGIFLDESNQKERNINDFKRSFGGKEVDEVKIFQSYSLKGKLALLYMRWKWRNNKDYLRAMQSIDSSSYSKSAEKTL